MLVDEPGDVPAGRDDVVPPTADIIEGAANETFAEAVPTKPRIDDRVVEDEDTVAIAVLRDGDDSAAIVELVAGPLGDVTYLHAGDIPVNG